MEKQRGKANEKTLEAFSQQRDSQKLYDEISVSLQKAGTRTGSNIPPHIQDFRAELAAQLSFPESDLPFLTELLEVKSSESRWRGAIERAIGSERLRILVPEDALDAALRWVNHRDNRLHVRLQCANRHERPVKFFTDGYTQKLNFKDHPFQNVARQLLASRDLHCVSSPEALKTTEHGLTMEGMMSGRSGKFEKQDQKRLNEDWMTGFDNKDQLEALNGQLKEVRISIEHWSGESKKRGEALDQLDDQLKMIDLLIDVEYSEIDQPGAERELIRSRRRHDQLLDPNSDAGQAKQALDQEDEKLQSIGNMIREWEKKASKLEAEAENAENEYDRAGTRIVSGLIEEEAVLAKSIPPSRRNSPQRRLAMPNGLRIRKLMTNSAKSLEKSTRSRRGWCG